MQRRISLEEDFMNYSSNDILYGYMLASSTYHPVEKKLYLSKKNYFEKEIPQIVAKLCGKSKRTIERHLAVLMSEERKLVAVEKLICGDKEEECFVFPYDYDGAFQLVENDMLEYVVHTRNNCAVRIYVYLLNKYLWKKPEDYLFTSKELLAAMGYSPKSNSSTAYKMVADILESFQREGIMTIGDTFVKNGDDQPVPYKVLKFVAQKRENLIKI